jgi:hypothetical protein
MFSPSEDCSSGGRGRSNAKQDLVAIMTHRLLSAAFAVLVTLCLAGTASAYTAENPTLLNWDGGETETGLQAISQPAAAEGYYYFRIGSRSATVWRTRLTVTEGEADLYMAKGHLPVPGASGTKSSVRPGSDGLVLANSDFGGGETWYILVAASGPANAWSLVSGDPYVHDLGNLPYTDSNLNGAYNIGEPSQNGGVSDRVMGPEGVSFFKVTLPPNVPAWALWMNGGQQLLGVRKNLLPVLFKLPQLADRKRTGSLLLVPPYLGQGSDSYFVSVQGDPGSTYSLDSRIQQIEDIAFEGTVPDIQVEGAPYRVFRVEVPAQQVIWDLGLQRLAGDPNLCVRKQTVPAESDNDALSEAAGEVNDSITLVSPDLTNGTWFITLFGSGPYQASLKSGTPEITDIGYRSVVTNDQPDRSGWRYYRVPDIGAQLGSLGWQLELENAPPGTEISVRRALAPGAWKLKTNGSTTATSVRHVDFSSAHGILQRVDHEADIWYVGVYQPEAALGNYQLTLTDIVAQAGSFNDYEVAVNGQIEGEWRYFRINVPNDPALLGWYVDLHQLAGNSTAKITVRRDRLPPAPAGSPVVTATSASWPSGAHWEQPADFSGIMQDFDGRNVAGNHFLAASGPLRPLQAGTYYVGVLAGNGQPAGGSGATVSYSLRSRGIGAGYSIPVTPLDLAGGSATINGLAPREFRFFSFTIPQGMQVPSWDLRLAQASGEMHLQVRRDSLPDFSTSAFVGEALGVTNVQGGKRLKKTGQERLTLLPEQGQSALSPGTYYAAVISEGNLPTVTKLGELPATGTLSSSLPVPVADLGTLGEAPVEVPFAITGGELAIYRVTVPPGSRLLETSILGRTGNPGISVVRGTAVPKPFPALTTGNAAYGWTGGQTAPNHPRLVSVHEPEAGVYTIVVRANADSNNNLIAGGGTLQVRLAEAFPVITALGPVKSHSVTGHVAEGWRYITLVVPENESIKGIYVSLRDVTAGLPRMVIRRGTGLPKEFVTTALLDSDSIAWPDGSQWYHPSDYSTIARNSAGAFTGRGFLCAYNAPMGPGTYTIGVSKDASINTVTTPGTPDMAYTVQVDCIGENLDYDLETLDPESDTAFMPAVAERDHRFFKITLPPGMTSWRIKLAGANNTAAPPVYCDGMLAIRKNHIPAFDIAANPFLRGGTTVRLLTKDDYWTILPTDAGGTLPGGDYYVAATSLGAKPGPGQSGVGPGDLTLTTNGELPVISFPPLAVDVDTATSYALGPAEIAAYEFVIPERADGLAPYGFIVGLDRAAGGSNFSIRRNGPGGSSSPVPPGLGADGFSGGLPFDYASTDGVRGQIVYQATPGTYRVIVRSSQSGGGYSDASGQLAVRLLDTGGGIPTIDCDGGSLNVTGGGADIDILAFRVILPDEPNWKAWGARLVSPLAGRPAMTVRRDQPVGSLAGPQVDSDDLTWPTLAQWSQMDDYTKLRYDPAAPVAERDRSLQFFAAARGRPMEPGTYFIGIDNRGTSLISPRTFTLETFTVGEGYSVPVSDLSAVGSSAAISVESPRMPSVHKITIPPSTRAWALSLANTQGDFTLRVRKDFVPDPVNSTYPDLLGGVHVQKAGDERFTLLPQPGQDFIPAGDYYIAAVSEGRNSSVSSLLIGSGSASAMLTNLGPIEAAPLGTVGEAGLSLPVVLEAAEVKFFSVEVPAGINNLQFRLNDRSGEASLCVLPGTRLPAPGLNESYGVFGGQTGTALKKDKAIVNLGNPAPGIYTIAVRAGGTAPAAYSPAAATLSIDILKPAPLNFSAAFNGGNGFSHTDARSLADKQKYFYRVAIPPQGEGEEILGWLVTVDQGSPIVRFYKSASDFGGVAPVTMTGRTALIVPPFLTFGTNWFIEVEGAGTTDYVLRSEPVTLAAEPWSLGAAFNILAGDSNPGAPDGLGISRELPQDHWEFYALDVPEDNLGLMRIALEASNGNPNVYIRQNGIPTTDHRNAGVTGTPLYEHKMIREDSEAGNFSDPGDPVVQPQRLKSGRWYIGVKSDPVGLTRTSSRYRLKAHSGVVTDIDLTTPLPLTDQFLAEKDWRYYRVTIPRSGVPENWLPAFTRLHGTAQLYIRDTLPPFSYLKNTANSATMITLVDWSTDLRNKVVAGSYVAAPAPGTVSLPVPPLRPGKTYYLGFYGSSGGSFEVSSSVSAAQLVIDAELPYDSGSASFTLPPQGKRLLRFHVPPEATRVKFDCVQSADGVLVKLEQGAPPDSRAGVSAHLQSPGTYPANFQVNRVLGNLWPFVANEDYYILLTNFGTAPITSTITMKGVSALTEDEDNDGVPDAWERLYFGSHGNYLGLADPDLDGSTNLQEYQNGTIPNDPESVLYAIQTSAPAGSVSLSPQLALYPRNTQITLSAVPPPGGSLRRWSSPGTVFEGSTNPVVTFPITSNVVAKAIFELPLAKALDGPDSQVWSNTANAWFGQFEFSSDGQHAASSPPLGSSSSATMSTILTGPGTLSFHWRVSSRADSGVLTLLLDGVAQPGAISGLTMTEWAQVNLPIPAGDHTVAWRYAKNSLSLQGEDRGWVDRVTYTGWPSDSPSFAAWTESAFTASEQGNPAISGADADPDGDGIANVLEAALGTGPKSPDASGAALILAGNTRAGANRTISLQSQVAGTPLSNIMLRLQMSANPASGNWVTLASKTGAGAWNSQSSTQTTELDTGGAREPVVFEETVQATGSERRYYRLSAELMP